MAKSKAKKEEESIFDALVLLEKEMNIPTDYMIEKISNAIRIALKKSNNGNDDVEIRIEPENKIFSVIIRKTVVEDVKDSGREIRSDFVGREICQGRRIVVSADIHRQAGRSDAGRLRGHEPCRQRSS